MRPLSVVLALLLLTGCGGGGKDHLSPGTSKAAYLVAAEKICAKANADTKAVTFPSAQAALPAYVGTLVGIADAATQELAALSAPVADAAALQSKLLTPLQTQVAEAKTYQRLVAAAVASHNEKALGALIGSPPTRTRADLAWMRSYGFVACVEAADTTQ